MIHKLLILSIIFFSYIQSTAQVFYHELSISNFEEDFVAVGQHLATLNEEPDVDINIGIVKHHLRYLLDDTNEPFPFRSAPQMCINSSHENLVSLIFHGEFELFHFNHFKLNTYNELKDSTNAGLYSLELVEGVGLNLFALYGRSGSIRSNLSIIIIDKDLSFCGANGFRTSTKIEQDTIIDNLTSLPNPALNHTRVSFHLKQAQQVSLELIDPASGRIIARKLDRQYLPSGTHQYVFDFQAIPKGAYYFILKTEKEQQSIAVIKI